MRDWRDSNGDKRVDFTEKIDARYMTPGDRWDLQADADGSYEYDDEDYDDEDYDDEDYDEDDDYDDYDDEDEYDD